MNQLFEKVAAVVPSLNPDEKLPLVVKGLVAAGFQRILLIDDGSAPEYKFRFKECAEFKEVTLLVHPENKGKGAAMKTAFRYILDKMPDCSGVVTVDGDNQHRPEDCRHCVLEMLEKQQVVLGVRDFSKEDVPKKSRMGNNLTRRIFRIFCGMKISDTQTGLRAFPIKYLEQMTKVEGDRYEYETQMLLDFKTFRIPFFEVPIETVYIEENQTSHFRVVKDSFRIYRIIFSHFLKYSLASVVSYILEFCIMLGTQVLLTKYTELQAVGNYACAFLVARACSSVFNCVVNHKLIFHAKCSPWQSFRRYYALCLPLAAVGLFFGVLGIMGVDYLNFLPKAITPFASVVIHPLVQVIMFLLTYKIQKEWVYKTETECTCRKKKS